MPYTWVDAEVALEHKGAKVYHTYKNDIVENGANLFLFAPYPWCSQDDPETFDVVDLARTLGVPRPETQEEIYFILRLAIERGLLTENGLAF